MAGLMQRLMDAQEELKTEREHSEKVLRLLVATARLWVPPVHQAPITGDLVVETTRLGWDPDAIGWLVGHDWAPYEEKCGACGQAFDGSDDAVVPSPLRLDTWLCGNCGRELDGREVWDVRPLNPQAKIQYIDPEPHQRWENATFRRVADSTQRLAKELGL